MFFNPNEKIGKVKYNGVLNVIDLLAIIWHIVDPDNNPFDSQQFGIADSNQDGIIDILDIVNLINDILGDDLARSLTVKDQVNLKYTSYSIILENDGFIGLDLTLEHSVDDNISFDINQESIVGECKTVAESISRCIIATDQSGEIIRASAAFKILEIKAAIPEGYVEVNLSELPIEFSIGKAYPNPFNPIVQFDYSIPIKSDLLIQVYDLNGKVITTLANDVKNPGNYTMAWNADRYSSGVYFIKFAMNNSVKTQKVMLLK